MSYHHHFHLPFAMLYGSLRCFEVSLTAGLVPLCAAMRSLLLTVPLVALPSPAVGTALPGCFGFEIQAKNDSAVIPQHEALVDNTNDIPEPKLLCCHNKIDLLYCRFKLQDRPWPVRFVQNDGHDVSRLTQHASKRGCSFETQSHYTNRYATYIEYAE